MKINWILVSSLDWNTFNKPFPSKFGYKFILKYYLTKCAVVLMTKLRENKLKINKNNYKSGIRSVLRT